MDLRKVKKLIELADESGIAELEVTSGDESVRITMVPQAMISTSVAPAPATLAVRPATTDDAVKESKTLEGSPVVAPMAGTFYRAPSPEAPPYVEIGDTVAAGDVVCIIESMKMMHEIRAASGGRVASILIENGTPIGTGEVLFLLS